MSDEAREAAVAKGFQFWDSVGMYDPVVRELVEIGFHDGVVEGRRQAREAVANANSGLIFDPLEAIDALKTT